MSFAVEVEHTVHVAVFRLTETVQRSLSWSLSLISARTRKKSFSNDAFQQSFTLATRQMKNPKLSLHTAGKNSSTSPSRRTAFRMITILSGSVTSEFAPLFISVHDGKSDMCRCPNHAFVPQVNTQVAIKAVQNIHTPKNINRLRARRRWL